MITAVNRVFEHEGRQFHLQAEDLGEPHSAFEARVYESGGVLWLKRISYDDLLARKLPRLEQDEAVRALMEKTLHTVQAAIAKGKLG
jgi:hypothetical protein